jgi:type VI secretion system secreted protein Hcp
MATDIFLKIEEIPGESQDAVHKGEIEILSYSWGLSQTSTIGSGGGGGGAGKASFQDLHFESRTSKASPLLAKFCATGEHIKKAQLSVRKAGAQAIEYIKMTLEDCIVSSYQQAASSDGDRPEDAFSLNFAKIEFDYFPQKADGSLDAAVIFSFDRVANTTG